MTNEAKETLMNVWKAYAPLIPERNRQAFMVDLAALVGVCIESSVTEFKAKLEAELPGILRGKS